MSTLQGNPRTRKRVAVGILLLLVPLVSMAAVAWACNPQAHLALDQSSYEAGSTITATGAYFPPAASVTVSGPTGSTVVTTSAGGGFTVQLTAPLQPGNYTITASRPTGEFAPASFTVVAASAPPVTAPPAEQTVPSPALGFRPQVCVRQRQALVAVVVSGAPPPRRAAEGRARRWSPEYQRDSGVPADLTCRAGCAGWVLAAASEH